VELVIELEQEPKRCLMQVPSMRVVKREPISAATWGASILKRLEVAS
jgi:hypothetical protein